MDKIDLAAQPRKVVGRKVKKLRGEGLLPANIFGKGVKSTSIAVSLADFLKVFEKAGETGLVALKLEGKKDGEDRVVLVSNVQKDPISGTPLHVDFRQVDLKAKITAQVPVEFVGESPAEKQSLGTVVKHINEIEVEALPADLPDRFEVDLSILAEVDQAIFVKDLKHSKDVEIKSDAEAIVAKVEPPQKIEEVAPAPAAEVAAEGEVPAGTEGEGQAPTEGEGAVAENQESAAKE